MKVTSAGAAQDRYLMAQHEDQGSRRAGGDLRGRDPGRRPRAAPGLDGTPVELVAIPSNVLVPGHVYDVKAGGITVAASRTGTYGLPAARAAALACFAGGPARTVGAYSSSWMRPSKVRLLIMSSATSG